VPISALGGRRITTVEGLGTIDKPGPMQRAFIEEQAAQCGYCIPGMMMRAQELLEQNASPTREEIKRHMNPNLCRCGTHMRIVRAVARAAELMRGTGEPAASGKDKP
jgi:aerobic-type carbon monoxide dehydrogenase small subunit (CoxS/CutS family)